jgi:spore maturation protein CgeB
MNTPNIDVVAIIHTYAQDRELGSYFNCLLRGFSNTGVRLHLIITNDLVDNLGDRSLKKDVSSKKIVDYINSISPAFVFTTNHGGINKQIQEGIHCPILTWMVDRIPFLHHGGSHDDLFSLKDHVITSSLENVDRLEKIYPILKNRVYYLPFATDVNDFEEQSSIQDINISFVGTYFYCGNLTNILNAYKNVPEFCNNIIKLAKAVEKDYDLDFYFYLKQYNVERVLKDFDLDIFKFKGLLANAISINKRIKALDAINDLGLVLYGTENWIQVNPFSLDLLSRYQFGHFIKSRQQLVSVYQRSKIALNVSHHQAVNGLPYRIFDIMASKAMLLTEYKENSDLFYLFGKKMPVVMYKNEIELRKLTQYYLEHENERLEIVYRCNKLIKEGFSFEDRVKNFFSVLNLPLKFQKKGDIIYCKSSLFLKNKNQLNSIGKFSFKNIISIIIYHFLTILDPSVKLTARRYLRFILPNYVKIKLKEYLHNK